MRERLIELIRTGMRKHEITIEHYVIPTSDYLADYLLENGVIVTPFKDGDKVYTSNPLGNRVMEGEVVLDSFVAIAQHMHFGFSSNDIGKTVFLTREEAEQALKGGAE